MARFASTEQTFRKEILAKHPSLPSFRDPGYRSKGVPTPGVSFKGDRNYLLSKTTDVKKTRASSTSRTSMAQNVAIEHRPLTPTLLRRRQSTLIDNSLGREIQKTPLRRRTYTFDSHALSSKPGILNGSLGEISTLQKPNEPLVIARGEAADVSDNHLSIKRIESSIEYERSSHTKDATMVFFPLHNPKSSVVVKARQNITSIQESWSQSTRCALSDLRRCQDGLDDTRSANTNITDKIKETDDKIAMMESMHHSLSEYLSHLQSLAKSSRTYENWDEMQLLTGANPSLPPVGSVAPNLQQNQQFTSSIENHADSIETHRRDQMDNSIPPNHGFSSNSLQPNHGYPSVSIQQKSSSSIGSGSGPLATQDYLKILTNQGKYKAESEFVSAVTVTSNGVGVATTCESPTSDVTEATLDSATDMQSQIPPRKFTESSQAEAGLHQYIHPHMTAMRASLDFAEPAGDSPEKSIRPVSRNGRSTQVVPDKRDNESSDAARRQAIRNDGAASAVATSDPRPPVVLSRNLSRSNVPIAGPLPEPSTAGQHHEHYLEESEEEKRGTAFGFLNMNNDAATDLLGLALNDYTGHSPDKDVLSLSAAIFPQHRVGYGHLDRNQNGSMSLSMNNRAYDAPDTLLLPSSSSLHSSGSSSSRGSGETFRQMKMMMSHGSLVGSTESSQQIRSAGGIVGLGGERWTRDLAGRLTVESDSEATGASVGGWQSLNEFEHPHELASQQHAHRFGLYDDESINSVRYGDQGNYSQADQGSYSVRSSAESSTHSRSYPVAHSPMGASAAERLAALQKRKAAMVRSPQDVAVFETFEEVMSELKPRTSSSHPYQPTATTEAENTKASGEHKDSTEDVQAATQAAVVIISQPALEARSRSIVPLPRRPPPPPPRPPPAAPAKTAESTLPAEPTANRIQEVLRSYSFSVTPPPASVDDDFSVSVGDDRSAGAVWPSLQGGHHVDQPCSHSNSAEPGDTAGAADQQQGPPVLASRAFIDAMLAANTAATPTAAAAIIKFGAPMASSSGTSISYDGSSSSSRYGRWDGIRAVEAGISAQSHGPYDIGSVRGSAPGYERPYFDIAGISYRAGAGSYPDLGTPGGVRSYPDYDILGGMRAYEADESSTNRTVRSGIGTVGPMHAVQVSTQPVTGLIKSMGAANRVYGMSTPVATKHISRPAGSGGDMEHNEDWFGSQDAFDYISGPVYSTHSSASHIDASQYGFSRAVTPTPASAGRLVKVASVKVSRQLNSLGMGDFYDSPDSLQSRSPPPRIVPTSPPRVLPPVGYYSSVGDDRVSSRMSGDDRVLSKMSGGDKISSITSGMSAAVNPSTPFAYGRGRVASASATSTSRLPGGSEGADLIASRSDTGEGVWRPDDAQLFDIEAITLVAEDRQRTDSIAEGVGVGGGGGGGSSVKHRPIAVEGNSVVMGDGASHAVRAQVEFDIGSPASVGYSRVGRLKSYSETFIDME